MRTMLTALASALLFATAASAASVTITPDKAVYTVGETITLTVVGDAQGASSRAFFGRLRWSPALVAGAPATTTQSLLTSFTGILTWELGELDTGVGFANAMNQLVGLTTRVPDQNLVATITLTAVAPGQLDVSWETNANTGFELMFFGLTNAPGISVEILPAVPAIPTAGPIGLGLLAALGVAGGTWALRRSRSSR